MAAEPTFILGEYQRQLDERHRLSIPSDLVQALGSSALVLVKEQPGALSLWNADRWQPRWQQDLELIESKMKAGRLAGRLTEVQRWGRLVSTRQCAVQLAKRGRLLIPAGFREFLGVDLGGSVMVVGAALCIEIWHPASWRDHLAEQLATFHDLEDHLTT